MTVLPKLIPEVFALSQFESLTSYLRGLFHSSPEAFQYSETFGRHTLSSDFDDVLRDVGQAVLPLVREETSSATKLPTYSLYARYSGFAANLPFHKDDNACECSLNVCLGMLAPWPISVNGTEYTLKPNQAILYEGERHLHGRYEFPDPQTNVVECLFLFFAEPNHWYFTAGPGHIRAIRNELSV